MTQQNMPVAVTGRCIISDDLGNIILDQENAIHSKNMSRIFARALSNEGNYYINRIAFGNGGTTVDASHNVNFNKPHDGNRPHDAGGYKSRLYNETYSEIVNENGGMVGTGPGTSALNDPASIPNNLNGPGAVSIELGQYSQVQVTCVLNRYEPSGEYITSVGNGTENADGSFAFDEIGLFTGGVAQDIPTNGYQTVTISTPNLYVNTGLTIGSMYNLSIDVDGVRMDYKYTAQNVSSIAKENYIKFSDLVTQLNNSIPELYFSMSNGSSNNSYYGYLKVTSKSNGLQSKVKIVQASTDAQWLFNKIPLFVGLNDPVDGSNAGVQNMADAPERELSRMLTHLIFNPITKPADRVYIIKYLININVPPTIK